MLTMGQDDQVQYTIAPMGDGPIPGCVGAGFGLPLGRGRWFTVVFVRCVRLRL